MKKIFLLSIILYSFVVNAQNDTIITKNNNLIVGEIKSLAKGVLEIETNYSDSDFKLEWDKVKKINTESKFILYLSNGDRLTTKLKSVDAEPYMVSIGADYKMIEVPITEIVYLKSLKETFISRLSASLDLGLNVTKANNLIQFNARSNVGYLTENWNLTGGFDVVKSQQDSTSRVYRMDAKLGYDYFLKHGLFLSLSNEFSQNDEQQLKLRTNIKTGLGYYLVRTNTHSIGFIGGIALNSEQYNISADNRTSAESYFGVGLNLFDIGDLNLMTNINVYPNLTEKGRVRSDFKFDLKYDLPLDFYIKLGTTINYDNRPVEDATEYDYVLQTSFGWEL